ncbi:MAG: DUF3368 domain-containing protein [Hormoscilla sp.]
MPKIIADTSCIQYLYQTDLLSLLPILYNEIILPQAVVDELAIGIASAVSLPNIASISWIAVRQAIDREILPQVTELGSGEKEAIALALEIPDSLVILDDALGRRCAGQLGVKFTGTLGVLLKAKQAGHLSAVAPILDQLDALRFRLDASTRATVLKLAAEL